MFKKLIFSSALVMMLFSFNTEVHAEKSDKTKEIETTKVAISESDILLSSYVNSDDKSSDILNTTFLKSELMEMDTGLIEELLEDLIAIEEPSESDSKVMLSTLQALNNLATYKLNGPTYFKEPAGLDNMKADFEKSNYPKELIKKGSAEFKEAMDSFNQKKDSVKQTNTAIMIFMGCVAVFAVALIIITTKSSDTVK